MSLLGPPAVRCHRIARWSRGVWAITAYEDLVELGHLDAAGLQLLFELARQEAHRFPSLAPPEGWTADALWDLAHDFFVDRGARVTTMLLAQASDEASIGRLLRRSLRNYLIDQVRKTDLGALRRRLEELLSDDPAVERVRAGEPGAGWWRLAGTSAAPWGGRCQRGSWDPAGALVEQHTTKSDRRATIAARYRSCSTRGGRWMPGPQAIGRGVHAALSHCSGVG